MSETVNPCQTFSCPSQSDVGNYSADSGNDDEPTITSSPGETTNPCQAVQCSNDADVDIYSTEELPAPLPVPVPVATLYGNAEQTGGCCEGDELIDYSGTTSSKIVIDRDNNCVVIPANSFRQTTQAQANAAAQSFLSSFIANATSDGSLACITGDVAVVATIVGMSGTSVYQAAFDPINDLIWMTWGYQTAGPWFITRVNITDNTLTESSPTVGIAGIQYVEGINGLYDTNRMYGCTQGNITSFIMSSPYSDAQIAAINNRASGVEYRRTDLWVPEKKTLYFSLGFNGITFTAWIGQLNLETGASAETPIPAVANNRNYVYNPIREELLPCNLSTGITAFNTNAGTITNLLFAGAQDSSFSNCAAYCEDNGYIYVPYKLAGTSGVALLNASTNVFDYYQTLSTAVSITGIVYHKARRCMYAFGTGYCGIIDAEQYDQGASMIVQTLDAGDGFTGTISQNSSVYCPKNRRIYIGTTTSILVLS